MGHLELRPPVLRKELSSPPSRRTACPGRCRRSALGALIAALAVAAGASPAMADPPARAPGQAPDPPPSLAIGITESNPNLIRPVTLGTPSLAFDRWREELLALRPRYIRLMIDWRRLQPAPDVPANLDLPEDGCVRGLAPCAGWSGLRDLLAAVAAAQAEGGWEALAVITGTPEWAASPARGCERPGEAPRSRPPREEALPAYRQLVLDVLAAAAEAGAEIRWWSPWNEPNHPFFLSPQRDVCDPASPTLGPAAYLPLVRALDQALAEAPGDQRRVLGELAGVMGGSRFTTSIRQFIAALPREVVCASEVWTLHAYVPSNPRTDVLAATEAALDRHACERSHEIWASETGLGATRANQSDDGDPFQDRAGACERLHAWLLRWYEHPRLTAAFQYTFRQDPVFRVGLITTSMDRAFGTLQVWRAWGARPGPDSPPPELAQACGADDASG